MPGTARVHISPPCVTMPGLKPCVFTLFKSNPHRFSFFFSAMSDIDTLLCRRLSRKELVMCSAFCSTPRNQCCLLRYAPPFPPPDPQTKTHVKVYNLKAQSLVKTLVTGCKWISSMAIHPGGDNLIIGSYDRRLCWFDLDLSTKPYRTLRFVFSVCLYLTFPRYHKLAIRQVAFHSSYPLFASCSDDGAVDVFHGMVYK